MDARSLRSEESELGLSLEKGVGRSCLALAETDLINTEIFDQPLDVVAGFGKGNPLPPVHRIATRLGRFAVGVEPFLDVLATGIIGGERQDIGALVLGQKFAQMARGELGIDASACAPP